MAGQLVEHRFIKRAEGQHRLRACGNLGVTGIVDKVRGNLKAAGFLLQRIEVLCFRCFEAYFLLSRCQPSLNFGWMGNTGVEEGLNRCVADLGRYFSLAHLQRLVDHAHEFDGRINGTMRGFGCG